MPDEIMTTATADSEVQQPTTEQVVTGDTAQVEQVTTEQPPRTFTQAELDSIIEKRLGKEKQRFETETKTAAQAARDATYAEMGYEWKGKAIKTEAEYRAALQEQELENKIRAQYANVPDEIVNEILEGKKFRTEFQTMQETQKQKEQKQKDYADFIDWHTKTKGSEPDPKTIPTEVWKKVKEGTPLKFAYMEYDHNVLRGQLQKGELQGQVQQANAKNAGLSTGSVKSAGPAGGDFISFETFEQNKDNQRWVIKNLTKINESRAKW